MMRSPMGCMNTARIGTSMAIAAMITVQLGIAGSVDVMDRLGAEGAARLGLPPGGPGGRRLAASRRGRTGAPAAGAAEAAVVRRGQPPCRGAARHRHRRDDDPVHG